MIDPVKPDPEDFFPFFSVHGEFFYFTRPVCGFPGATFTYPAYFICACLKRAKQRPDRKRKAGGKFADPVTFFFRKRGDNIDATRSVTESFFSTLAVSKRGNLRKLYVRIDFTHTVTHTLLIFCDCP